MGNALLLRFVPSSVLFHFVIFKVCVIEFYLCFLTVLHPIIIYHVFLGISKEGKSNGFMYQHLLDTTVSDAF